MTANLKALAEAAYHAYDATVPGSAEAWRDFLKAANPAAILALLAEMEGLRRELQCLRDAAREQAAGDPEIGVGVHSHSIDCPHAAPFRYCPTCIVSPCPIGLDAAQSTGERK